MSKENDHLTNGQGDPGSSGQTELSGGKKQPVNKPGLPTIEEHAKNLNINAPVFAAVMQGQKWASGKRVPLSVFEKAVKDFLDASMGGA